MTTQTNSKGKTWAEELRSVPLDVLIGFFAKATAAAQVEPLMTEAEQLRYHVAKWDEWSQAARATLLRLPPLEAQVKTMATHLQKTVLLAESEWPENQHDEIGVTAAKEALKLAGETL